eukprot:scaffold2456_cov129-Isochrysis_galbana.AAC.7
MTESRPPLESSGPFHESDETRARWPDMHRTCFSLSTSQICTLWSEVPTAMYVPSCTHESEVTCVFSPGVCMSCWMEPSDAFHK